MRLTPFVGRQAEVAEVAALLAGTRLLTVIGMGGAGKTRLAVEVAEGVGAGFGGDFRDGVRVVELAAVPEPALVPATVLAALGLEVGAMLDAGATVHRIAEHLADRRMLLVVDNCEHLVGACAELVAGLLPRCPGLTVLATSREVLGVPGEVVWPIPPMGLPPRDAEAPDDLAGSDAVALFCGRAGAALPGFVLDKDNAAAVAKICHRLDGIPLALELAAARIRVLAPAEIAAGLDDRFALLTSGSRLALRHQQTLRAAMDWSHDLLLPDEQVALRRLAVFGASFDLAAAAAVLGPSGAGPRDARLAALDVIARLADKSLLTVGRAIDVTRYRLLETVREYALERLAAAGEAEEVRARHRARFAALAREWQARPGDPWWAGNLWPSRLAADEDSFRAAVVSALDAGDTAAALDLVAALWMFWLMSFRAEGIDLLERAVAASPGAAHPSRVTALYALAYLRSYSGDVDAARAADLLDEAVALTETLERPDWMAHHGRADLALRGGDLPGALSAARTALQRAEAHGAPVGIAYCERLLGWVASAAGDTDAARQHFERSLAEGWHCDLSTAHAAGALAPLLAAAGDWDRADSLAAEALTRARRSPLGLVEAMALVQAAKVGMLSGDLDAAAGRAADLLALLARTGARAWVADAFDACVLVLGSRGRAAGAARLAGACDALREERGEHGVPDLAAERAAVRARCRDALGASAWERHVASGRAMTVADAVAFGRAELALPPQAAVPAVSVGRGATLPTAVLRQVGDTWEVAYAGRHAYLRDAKGMHDLATLLARPGEDVHVLELASPDPRLAGSAAQRSAVLDGAALAAYRRRLSQLDSEEADAVHARDDARLGRLDAERAAIKAELRAATGFGGRPRPLGADATERARKAVAARLREATRRISSAVPDLGAHLDRSVVTGTSCRYAPREALTWVLRPD